MRARTHASYEHGDPCPPASDQYLAQTQVLKSFRAVTHREMVRLGIRLASGVSVSSLPAQLTRLRAPLCAVWPLARSSVQLQPLERSSRHARAGPSSCSTSSRSTISDRPQLETRALRRNIIAPFSVTRNQPMSPAQTFTHESLQIQQISESGLIKALLHSGNLCPYSLFSVMM